MQTMVRLEGMMCIRREKRAGKVCKAVSGIADAAAEPAGKMVTGNANAETLKIAVPDADCRAAG